MSYTSEILSLIPQGIPFVMIDDLLFADELSAKTILTISKDNVLVENDVFQESGLIENVAQTVAARAGYESKMFDKPVTIGYIGAVSDLNIFDLPKVGKQLQTEIVIENHIFNVVLVSGKITCDNSLILTCKMKIFLPEQ